MTFNPCVSVCAVLQ